MIPNRHPRSVPIDELLDLDGVADDRRALAAELIRFRHELDEGENVFLPLHFDADASSVVV